MNDREKGRSREGAWIEINSSADYNYKLGVAPVRERGLKYKMWTRSDMFDFVAPVRERGLKFR